MRLNWVDFFKLVPAAFLGLPKASTIPFRQERKRARELGIRIGTMEPGPWNAITDVPGVMVGHATIVRGSGPLKVGEGPVRTGVTVVLPHDRIFQEYLSFGFQIL